VNGGSGGGGTCTAPRQVLLPRSNFPFFLKEHCTCPGSRRCVLISEHHMHVRDRRRGRTTLLLVLFTVSTPDPSWDGRGFLSSRKYLYSSTTLAIGMNRAMNPRQIQMCPFVVCLGFSRNVFLSLSLS
jgi:hypothetical protein